MTAIETRASANTKRATPSPSSQISKSKPQKKSSSTQPTTPSTAADDPLQSVRVTKHDRVLTLLSRREGATIPEMMAATDWQQHSVRGFLAGTVKKKLGFTLTSKKLNGEFRRYRIETKRGR
ncbi:DUF3489 domain-containing protein [Hyphomicrobium sp. ghe19]|uniref:DUF3489 domain-containing protein n=1 Tax=Hyphomicrobium sp. ghe19 TaxID=2682968 RepID=UPI00136715AA|nr:hypothetical protein HYPP_03200 [Hyphomicrobium sp. ghe19]